MKVSGITKATRQLGKVITKNSPTILTGLSVAGLVSTVALAVRATPKALQILDDEEYERGPLAEPLTKREIIGLTWKCYWPALVMGGATVACIVGANSINLRRTAAIASAYSLTETTLKEYRAKVVQTLGDKKAREIREEIHRDKIEKNPPNSKEVIITGVGEMLCYDVYSGRYFKSDVESIRRMENELNRDLINHMYVSLNDVYYKLGLDGIKMGETLGWNINDDKIDFSFSSHLTDGGQPAMVVDYYVGPRVDYKER